MRDCAVSWIQDRAGMFYVKKKNRLKRCSTNDDEMEMSYDTHTKFQLYNFIVKFEAEDL